MHDASNAFQNTSFPTALPTCDGERSGSLTANYRPGRVAVCSATTACSFCGSR